MTTFNATGAAAAPVRRPLSRVGRLEQRLARLAAAVAQHEIQLADVVTAPGLSCITRQRVRAAGRAQSDDVGVVIGEARRQFVMALVGLD